MSSAIDTIKDTVASNYRELSRGGQVVKMVLLISNAIIFLFGLVLIIVGGIAAGGQFNGLTSTTLASGVIVIGVLVMIVALIGAWGAMTENKKLLYTYFGLLLFFALILFAVGIAAYVRKDDLPQLASLAWDVAYQNDKHSVVTLQNTFQCCGWWNVTDRAVPPYGNEPTCSSMYPAVGACSTFFYEVLELSYMSQTDPAARLAMRQYQTDHRCCGWTNLYEPPTSFFQPWNETNLSQQCAQVNPSFTQTCKTVEQTLWYQNYYTSTPAGDAYILREQSEFVPNGCCGWASTTDAAVPPFTNNTCVQVYGYNTPCVLHADVTQTQSLVIVGGVGVALAVLSILTIILVLVLIVKIPNRSGGGGGGGARHDDNEGMEELHDEE